MAEQNGEELYSKPKCFLCLNYRVLFRKPPLDSGRESLFWRPEGRRQSDLRLLRDWGSSNAEKSLACAVADAVRKGRAGSPALPARRCGGRPPRAALLRAAGGLGRRLGVTPRCPHRVPKQPLFVTEIQLKSRNTRVFQLHMQLLSNKMEKDEYGSVSDSGKRRQKRRWCEAGSRRTAGCSTSSAAQVPSRGTCPWRGANFLACLRGESAFSS